MSTSLYDIGEITLARIVAEAANNGIELPARQVVYTSQIPVDCEQVAVLLGQWGPEPVPEQGFVPCASFRWAASISAIITRCTPSKLNTRGKGTQLPPVEAMNEVGRIASVDAEILLAVIMSFDEISNDAVILTSSPEGGYQTVEADFRVPGTMII